MERLFEINFEEDFLRSRKEREEKEIFEAREKVERIFSKFVELSNVISVGIVQRKLHIGYMKAAKFIDILAVKNIVSKEFGLRDILNKKQLVIEAVKYFTPIVRDEKKLNELNKNDIFVFAINNEFDVSNVSFYWLNRLISEQFIKDKIFVKTLDEIFGTCLSKSKDLSFKVMSVLSNKKIDIELLAIVTLQYFAEKLKNQAFNKNKKNYANFKEKINNLRFFDNDKGENK